jgi:ADP-ribosyl-[dinitrogen reductase] hydrolase
LGDEPSLKRYALQQAHLTHNHPLSDAACLAVGRMVQQAILGAPLHRLRTIADDLVQRHPKFAFNRYSGNSSAYVVDTLQTVFHYLFSSTSFEACIIGVVNQGGDADTTGAIAGMIAGSLYGLEALPRHWLKRLDPAPRIEIDELAVRLARYSPMAHL